MYRIKKHNTLEQEDKLGEMTMKAFHGTNNDFSEFDLAYLGENTNETTATDKYFEQTAHLGFWFTSNRDFTAKVYDKVMECEIVINNPLEVDTLETLAYWIESQEKSGDELREMLMEQGFDSIVIEKDEEFEGTSYIVFTPEQITILK